MVPVRIRENAIDAQQLEIFLAESFKLFPLVIRALLLLFDDRGGRLLVPDY